MDDVFKTMEARKQEMDYMKDFARQAFFDMELYRDQFRCLWTAYCLRHGLDVDTAVYDNDLAALWNTVAEDEADIADWNDYDSFGNFMCRYLV